jgi:outer membrane protein TolC
VVQALEDFRAAEAAAQASRAQLEAAEEAYRVRLATYRVGATTFVDLLQDDLRVTEARLALVNDAINARVALARLQRAAVLD